METVADRGEVAFGPWHPGITSQIPREIRHLATIHRPDNVSTDVARAEELRDLTGLDCSELVAFRPERLALHELLIRVTADFSIPDGSRIEDLGINFRRIVGVLLSGYVDPELAAIRAGHEALRRQLAAAIDAELAALLPVPASSAASPRPAVTGLRALFGRDRGQATVRDPGAGAGAGAEGAAVAAWESRGADGRRPAAAGGLSRVGAGRIGLAGAPWPALGRTRHDRGARHRPRLQCPRQRGDRPADRAAAGEGRRH